MEKKLEEMKLENNTAPAMAPLVSEIMGIDLGTTNCAVAVYAADLVARCLPIGKLGKLTVPSCVKWEGGKKFTVGQEAYNVRHLPSVAYSVKRIMGTDSVITLVTEQGKSKDFTPVQISAEILKHLASQVADLYKPLNDCVITVPAYFNQRQIEDTVSASKLAGLNCVHILKEPTSASYVYSMMGYARGGEVLIYDLGGGTFDVTHMRFIRKDGISSAMSSAMKKYYGIDTDELGSKEEKYFCKVLGTYGDMQLGGDDIDKRVADIAAKGHNLTGEEYQLLLLKCEQFKKQSVAAAEIHIGDKMFRLTDEMLKEAIDFVFAKTIALLRDANIKNISSIVLVGGSTKSPHLRELLGRAFPGVELSATLNPDETVAIGAGCVAKAISGQENLAYQDVLPLSIGVLLDEKSVDFCLARNTPMPYTTNRVFYTMYDSQKTVDIWVYQGLSADPKEDTFLGRVTIADLPDAKAGEVPILVAFTLSAQGRLTVTSKIKGINKEHVLVVDNIFTVKQEETGLDECKDDFEKAWNSTAKGDDELLEILTARRSAKSKADKEQLELEFITKVVAKEE